MCFLASSNSDEWESIVFFAQSLPLSILLGRAQPNPSALCRQPTHHIQMAHTHTHTHAHTHIAGCLGGDCLLIYKRHFVFTGAASKFQRLVHVSSWWQWHSFFLLFIEINTNKPRLKMVSTILTLQINIPYCACTVGLCSLAETEH